MTRRRFGGSTGEVNMIGPGTTIRGNITGDEDLTVQGRVEGAVRLSKDLTIDAGAVVEAELDAANVALSGRVIGTVNAQDSLVVESGAVMVGDVTTPRLHIADGAHFKGRVTMDFEIPGVEAPKARRR
jgi:cytoskeletal protein CcmA (bactofilin family)